MRETRSLQESETSAHFLDLKLTSLLRMHSATLRREDAQNGGSPQRVTYRTTPALQMSDSGPYDSSKTSVGGPEEGRHRGAAQEKQRRREGARNAKGKLVPRGCLC